ncbi:uncharacterized protein LOC111900934 [Lactuca sativa]|uniref:uncharacterized protein LOC111900934 n=1 Tax=Lactuca sativa TaxID=4236 RepID=UPI000CD86EA0|nr:uncharacterized protein LOC111900934 [Lactuca sativa]
MRLLNDDSCSMTDFTISKFAAWLIIIGDRDIGQPDPTDDEYTKWIDIPSSFLIRRGDKALEKLIHFVYGDEILKHPSASTLSVGAIVCPKYDTTYEIKKVILKVSPGETKFYKSVDAIMSNGIQFVEFEAFYPVEYLNQLNFVSVLPHELSLKIGTPIMVLININQREWLCNGTRLMVSQLLPNVIVATIISGTCIGNQEYIPRIKFIHKAPDILFASIRQQFQVKVCYVMTINKSQDRSLKKIGVYLPQSVFTHGQLYVALSQATSPDSIKVLIHPNANSRHNKTKNVVKKLLSAYRKECTDIPERFNHSAIKNAPSPVLLAITNVKVTLVAGTLRLGTTSMSHMYINPPIRDVTALLERFKLVATIADQTDSMNAILSDNVTQKLLGARLDELITKDNLDHWKTLTLLSEKSKSFPIRMTVRMTKTSTHNNIRFMIHGVEDNVVQQPLVLTTPPTNISLPSDPVD